MSKNLYDAVMDLLQWNEEAEINKLKNKIKFPELDTQKLALDIEAVVYSRKDCVIVASNN